MGIGRAFKTEDDIKCEYVVARYHPAGNRLGEFDSNVNKGLFGTNSICNTIVGTKKQKTLKYIKAHDRHVNRYVTEVL